MLKYISVLDSIIELDGIIRISKSSSNDAYHIVIEYKNASSVTNSSIKFDYITESKRNRSYNKLMNLISSNNTDSINRVDVLLDKYKSKFRRK